MCNSVSLTNRHFRFYRRLKANAWDVPKSIGLPAWPNTFYVIYSSDNNNLIIFIVWAYTVNWNSNDTTDRPERSLFIDFWNHVSHSSCSVVGILKTSGSSIAQNFCHYSSISDVALTHDETMIVAGDFSNAPITTQPRCILKADDRHVLCLMSALNCSIHGYKLCNTEKRLTSGCSLCCSWWNYPAAMKV